MVQNEISSFLYPSITFSTEDAGCIYGLFGSNSVYVEISSWSIFLAACMKTELQCNLVPASPSLDYPL